MRIRFLPVLISTCCLFGIGKTVDLIGVGQAETAPAAASDDKAKTDASAADAATKDSAKDAAKDSDAKTDDAKTDAAADKKDDAAPATDDAKKDADAKTDDKTDAKADTADAKSDAKADDSAKADDKKTDAKKDSKEAKDAKPDLPDGASYQKPKEQIPEFTDSEKAVLQKLADRRAELDARSHDLEMKESLIDASSKKLDDKIAELKQLKSDTEALLKTYNEHEDAKLRSLVKIYESMKPDAAASIFEQMNMDIMLEIVDKMSEKKASLVLANMSPAKAKEVTEKLAYERSLRKPPTADASGAPAGAAQPAKPKA